jgi:hypothetical protein
MNSDIIYRFANFNSKNTKYRFNRVLYADLQSSRHTHLRGGTFIELPKYYKNKKCCINVNNTKTNKFKCLKQENLRCFEYALKSIYSKHLRLESIKYQIQLVKIQRDHLTIIMKNMKN